METTTGSVNMGFILERLAPVLEHFPFDKNDCRSLFTQLTMSYLKVYKKQGKCKRCSLLILNLEKAKLKPNQKAIKQMIEQKKIEFKNY